MADPREVEMKLELSGPDAQALARRGLKALGGGNGKRDTLRSVYYDTPERTLQKQGLTLRVRTAKAGTVQTVKAREGARSGLFDRAEWETAIAGPGPDREAWSKTPVGDALSDGPSLRPVFETVIERTIWTVAAGRSRIEAALDRGRVVVGAETQAFAEIELELKQGVPSDLFDLARRIGATQALRLGVVTKSERGYALASGKQPSSFKAEPIELARGLPAADAFRAVAHACLRQFRRNETVFVEKRTVESLHEARVGMRRLRSALSLFKDLIADEALPRFKDELRAVSRTLGDARNIDVYLERAVIPERDRNPSEPGVVAFLDKVRHLREQAYDHAIAALDAPGFRGLIIDLVAWIEAGPWASTDDPLRAATRTQPIEGLAADILDRRFKRVRKKGRRLAALDPAARHRVRIEAKKLRYAAEFFAGLARGKGERRRYDGFVKCMKAFQELLGDLNDLHTGHELAAELARRADFSDPQEAKLLFAAGHLSGEQDERVAGLLAKAEAIHADFAGQPKFWRSWSA